MSNLGIFDSNGKQIGSIGESGIEFEMIITFVVAGLAVVGGFFWGLSEACALAEEGMLDWFFMLKMVGTQIVCDLVVGFFVSVTEGDVFEFDTDTYLGAAGLSAILTGIGTIVVIVAGCSDLSPHRFAYCCTGVLTAVILAAISPAIAALLKIAVPVFFEGLWELLKILVKGLVKLWSFI